MLVAPSRLCWMRKSRQTVREAPGAPSRRKQPNLITWLRPPFVPGCQGSNQGSPFHHSNIFRSTATPHKKPRIIPNIAMSLCKACLDAIHVYNTWCIQLEAADLPATFRPHHMSLLGFLKSVGDKCYICCRAYEKLDAAGGQHLQHVESILISAGESGLPDSMDGQFLGFSRFLARTEPPTVLSNCVALAFNARYVDKVLENIVHGGQLLLDRRDAATILSAVLQLDMSTVTLQAVDEVTGEHCGSEGPL